MLKSGSLLAVLLLSGMVPCHAGTPSWSVAPWLGWASSYQTSATDEPFASALGIAERPDVGIRFRTPALWGRLVRLEAEGAWSAVSTRITADSPEESSVRTTADYAQAAVHLLIGNVLIGGSASIPLAERSTATVAGATVPFTRTDVGTTMRIVADVRVGVDIGLMDTQYGDLSMRVMLRHTLTDRYIQRTLPSVAAATVRLDLAWHIPLP